MSKKQGSEKNPQFPNAILHLQDLYMNMSATDVRTYTTHFRNHCIGPAPSIYQNKLKILNLRQFRKKKFRKNRSEESMIFSIFFIKSGQKKIWWQSKMNEGIFNPTYAKHFLKLLPELPFYFPVNF